MTKSFLTALILVCMGVQALSAQLEFDRTMFDFGTVDQGRSLTYGFVFQNKGGSPVKLKSVSSDCACVAHRWTTSEVAPGKEGEVELTFSSVGKIGPFEQLIKVEYEGGKPVTLNLKGVVAETKEAITYKDTVGDLVFDKLIQNIGVARSDQDAEFIFNVRNIGKKTIAVLPNLEHKAPFEIVPGFKALKKGEAGVVKVKFSGAKSREMKYEDNAGIEEKVSFLTDEATNNKKTLTLTGTFQRIYTPAELEQSARITFEKTEYNGGEILEGQTLKYSFNFTNTGKTDLEIQSAKASCGCTATAPKEKTIKPGMSSSIDAVFDSKYKRGTQQKTISVKTNDLHTPTVILTIKCTVKQDPFSQQNSGAPVNSPDDDSKNR